MTIDERLDRLTERHEALTQTVEIIAAMQKENEVRIRELGTYIREARRDVDDLGRFIRALAEIVASHERRLDRLEG